MAIIYRCATRVIIWLGDQDETSECALTFAAELGNGLAIFHRFHGNSLLAFSDLGKRLPGTDFILPSE